MVGLTGNHLVRSQIIEKLSEVGRGNYLPYDKELFDIRLDNEGAQRGAGHLGSLGCTKVNKTANYSALFT